MAARNLHREQLESRWGSYPLKSPIALDFDLNAEGSQAWVFRQPAANEISESWERRAAANCSVRMSKQIDDSVAWWRRHHEESLSDSVETGIAFIGGEVVYEAQKADDNRSRPAA